MQQGVYSYPATARIVYGVPFDEVLAQEVNRIDARRVFVISSGTLFRETDVIQRVQSALGDRFAGVCSQIGAHTPRVDVVAAASMARAQRADVVLTVGGGSVTDAGKMVGICLGNDITDARQLDSLRVSIAADGASVRPDYREPSVASIAIPTTLSAGEFSATAGCTDSERMVKELYAHEKALPQTVILDPAITLHTPEWLWLSTGIRAVDHSVEDLCSINPNPFSDGTSFQSLRLLAKGLRAVKTERTDLVARLDCQLGCWMSTVGHSAGVPKGASHGIGHVLGGTANVPHGYTSCVMLPHVLRFNSSVNGERQALVSDALSRPGEPAADVVSALIADLELPQTLREVGVSRDMFDCIAERSMHERWVHTNPRRIDGPDIVRQLLAAAW